MILTTILCSAMLAAPDAKPVVEKTPESITVRVPRLTATFTRESGWLLRTLATADGTALLTGSRIYHDHLMDHPRISYGPKAVAPPVVREDAKTGRVTVETKGRLLDAKGKAHVMGDVAYTVRYTFDRSARVRIETAVTVGITNPALRGFLAQIFSTAPQREFFANTAEGRLCEMAATRRTRTWQSANEPLSPAAPWLGCVLKSGHVLRFRIASAPQPLQNTFFHDSGQGPTAVFFAWLAGQATRPVKNGDTWRLALTLEATPLAQFKE